MKISKIMHHNTVALLLQSPVNLPLREESVECQSLGRGAYNLAVDELGESEFTALAIDPHSCSKQGGWHRARCGI